MTLVMKRSPEYQMSQPSQPQSPASQMSVNRIMDNQPQSPLGSRQLPPPMRSPTSSGPAGFKTVNEGRLYRLEIVQQPQRARMCGFGDKDRRPITPPPCIRLHVRDAMTGQPLDVNEIDISYFILTVDLWASDGQKEANCVRHSSTSPSISAATATSYPPEPSTSAFAHPNQPIIGHHFYPGLEAAQPNHSGIPYPLPRQNELSRHMEAAQRNSREEAMRIQHEQQQLQNQGHHHSLPKPSSRLGEHLMHPSTQAFLSGAMTATTNGLYQQSALGMQQAPLLSPNQLAPNVVDPRSQPGGMFTRNLIGNLAVTAARLTYPDKDLGVWFVLQDLSIRTEGTFRLKINFVDVGSASMVQSILSASQSSNPTTPHQPPSPLTSDPNNPSSAPPTALTNPQSMSPHALQTGKLNTGSAPILATTFSDEFQVYSAKKFPGVVDSTPLSKAFAKQGIKIPIRKDQGGTRGNERKEWEPGDE